MNFDYAAKISGLSHSARVRFYEALAHDLTIAARGVWSNDGITDTEKVHRLKHLNEIQHRVTAKIASTRLTPEKWPENEFAKVFNDWIRGCPEIAGEVGWSIQSSYKVALSHHHQS
jgi:hypothetical protein